LSSPKELSWITRIRYESNKVNKREKYEWRECVCFVLFCLFVCKIVCVCVFWVTFFFF
jgi:hypothetical protein